MFASCGGEANDLAIKLARGYTGRRKIISAIGGYHGHTGKNTMIIIVIYYMFFNMYKRLDRIN